MSNSDNTFSFFDVAGAGLRTLSDLPKAIRDLVALARANGEQRLSIGKIFEDKAKAYPQRPFLMFEGKCWSYQDFNTWVNRIAHLLKSNGIKSGDCVALMFENCPELLACVIAVSKLGAISGLLNHNQQGEVLTHSLRVMKPRMAIVGEECVSQFDEQRTILGNSVQYLWSGKGLCPSGYNNLVIESERMSPDNLPETLDVRLKQTCYYIFTSGTTGLPKAATMTHLRWYKGAIGMGRGAMRLKKEDVMYCPLPLYHNNALTVALSSVILCGASMAITRKFSATRFWDEVRAYGATAFIYVGELCRYLLNAPPQSTDLQNRLRVIIGNGLRPEIWDEFQQRFGIEHICEFYGASECNLAFVNVLNLKRTAGLCPLTYAIVRFDSEAEAPIRDSLGYLQPTAKGEIGLLLSEVSEKNPFDGYTDKRASEAKLLRNVFEPGDCWFNTGDLVKDQGYRHIAFVDRIGDTFRWKGENVATTEVEGVAQRLPSFAEAVVYGVQIPNIEGRAGMLSVTLNQGASFSGKEVFKHFQRHLPPYAIPLFVRVKGAQDITSTFKVKKTDLKKRGFELDDSSEPVYVLVDKEIGYVPLTSELYSLIKRGDVRF